MPAPTRTFYGWRNELYHLGESEKRVTMPEPWEHDWRPAFESGLTPKAALDAYVQDHVSDE